MKQKNAVLLGIAGAFCGAVLRFLDFYLYYDEVSGFLEDNGLLSYIGLGIMGAGFLLCLLFNLKNRQMRTVYKPTKGSLRGLASLAAAGGAFFAAWTMLQAYTLQRRQGIADVSTTGLSMRVPFIIATFVLALYLVFAAVVHLMNKEPLFKRAMVLELIPAIWGLLLILYVFIHYSVSILVPENIFVILSACSLTYALMNKAKYISGVDDGGLGLSRVSVAAVLAFMLYGAYFFSDAALLGAGSAFTGGLPFAVQTAAVLTAMNLLVFLLTARWEEKKLPEKERQGGKRFR